MPDTLTAPPPAAPAAPASPAPAAAPASPAAAPARVGGTAANKNPRPAKDGFLSKLQGVADKEWGESHDGKMAKAAADAKLVQPQPKPGEEPPAKPDDGKPAPAGDKPPDKAPEKAPDAPPAKTDDFPDEEAAGKMRAGELSRHYKALRKKEAAVRAEFEAFKTKAAAGAQPDPEVAKLKELAAASEKRVSELSEIVRFKAFEESPEYKDQYWKPYADAFQQARSKTAALKVRQRTDPDTGEVIQPGRQGTIEDFDLLFNTRDESEAGEIAEKLFGPNASQVLYHREKVLELNAKQLDAKDKYRKEGGEMEKKRGEQWSATQKQINEDAGKSWQKHVNSVLADEKQKPLFTKTDGDEEGNALLDKGYEEVKAAFQNTNAMDPRLTPEQRDKVIAAHAEVFNKAAAFNRVSYLLARAQKELKAKTAALKAIEDSAPTPGNGQQRTNAPIPSSNIRQGIYDRLEKRGVPVR